MNIHLEERIAAIENRNKRVEADKAWETSWFRVFLVAILTYAAMVLLFWQLKSNLPYKDALVPTAGFLLSTQSLPFLKRWWLKKYARL